mmetsp:Transcript_25477/g.25258  ORF Transcript_25477/g.25258 Transcript_25477/m.25258 type:complete len:133 (-) Transcript_25477:341-739(-)
MEILTCGDLEYKLNNLDKPYDEVSVRRNFHNTMVGYNQKAHTLRGQLNEKLSNRYEQEMEVLFLGSGNTGKSSLINAILQSKVAKTSGKLSKTQDLIRHKVGKNPNSKFVLIDSPGYGYSRAPTKAKKQFRK